VLLPASCFLSSPASLPARLRPRRAVQVCPSSTSAATPTPSASRTSPTPRPSALSHFRRVAGELVRLPELFMLSFSLCHATGVESIAVRRSSLPARSGAALVSPPPPCGSQRQAASFSTTTPARAPSALGTGDRSQDCVLLCSANDPAGSTSTSSLARLPLPQPGSKRRSSPTHSVPRQVLRQHVLVSDRRPPKRSVVPLLHLQLKLLRPCCSFGFSFVRVTSRPTTI
jgi:hypothetical protein